MGLLDFLLRHKQKSASVAKNRLAVIVARERRGSKGLDYLPQLRQELLQVIAKYEKIDLEQVSVQLEKDGDCDVLELSVVLSDAPSPFAPIF